MSKDPLIYSIALIGAGRVGTAVATMLSERGHTVAAVSDPDELARRRGADLTDGRPMDDAALAAGMAEVVLLTTPDDKIEAACREAASTSADLRGKKFIHMSGALSLSVLQAAEERGADVLSIHPLQSFADLEGAVRSLPGSTFAITCSDELEPWARAFVGELGGRAFVVADSDKVVYHAAAVIASNLPIMMVFGAQKLYEELGMGGEAAREAYMPLVRATIENIARLGPAEALTGPLARGDIGVLRSHLEALGRLDPVLADAYRAVCLLGIELVRELGRLEAGTVESMRDLVEQGGEAGREDA